MKCPECQADNPDEAEFCSLCYARFPVRLRASHIDEAAQRMREKHRGSRLRCPSCGELSPLDSQFCFKCGFVFEELEAILVSEEEVERINRAREDMMLEDMKTLLSAPIEVSGDADGAEVMRTIGDVLAQGHRACVQTHGRNATTHAMKIIALMGEDLRKQGKDLLMRVRLISEGAVTHLDEVELEITLESA